MDQRALWTVVASLLLLEMRKALPPFLLLPHPHLLLPVVVVVVGAAARRRRLRWRPLLPLILKTFRPFAQAPLTLPTASRGLLPIAVLCEREGRRRRMTPRLRVALLPQTHNSSTTSTIRLTRKVAVGSRLRRSLPTPHHRQTLRTFWVPRRRPLPSSPRCPPRRCHVLMS